ncbi:MAG: uroporphyrinogen decarboxylase, partial [Cyanobacteria bacterium]|nr:uroporphyrinogen decarboxylase [Cyanobacteriota bacterium]
MQGLARQPTARTPVWLMRQAGRYMPKYREIRSKVGFLEMCKDSDLACEVTVMAVNELSVDAGIIFADILLPLEPMGLGLSFVKGDGPVIARPIRTVEDIESLPDFDINGELNFVLS